MPAVLSEDLYTGQNGILLCHISTQVTQSTGDTQSYAVQSQNTQDLHMKFATPKNLGKQKSLLSVISLIEQIIWNIVTSTSKVLLS